MEDLMADKALNVQFNCPHCGLPIVVSVRAPQFLVGRGSDPALEGTIFEGLTGFEKVEDTRGPHEIIKFPGREPGNGQSPPEGPTEPPTEGA
jgi:hypothetical protein